jgi:hypothetical protein
MKTHFASAYRLEKKRLATDVSAATANPVIDGLLGTVSGLLAVLNEHRQILVINDSFLKMLGIEDAGPALGLRPGEAIGCIYRDVGAGGCGTSAYCTSCGAAIAIVTCLEHNTPMEKVCAVTVDRQGVPSDLFLRVRACPISVDGRRMILLFLQDITPQQQWEALGRIFFHDLNNIIYGLLGSSELLLDKTTNCDRNAVERIHRFSLRLAKEVQMQKHLTQMTDAGYQPMIQAIDAQQIIDELKMTFASHRAAADRNVHYDDAPRGLTFQSDFYLVVRILTNMIVNALEASDKGRQVKVWVTVEENQVRFCVWNHQLIDEAVVKRIFQRNISTKAETGRGLGTYSMKLFAETFLGGKVGFDTSASGGTTFRLRLSIAGSAGSGIIRP